MQKTALITLKTAIQSCQNYNNHGQNEEKVDFDVDPRPSSRGFIIGKVISAVIVDAIDIVFAAVVDGLTFPADRLTVASRLVHILDVG